MIWAEAFAVLQRGGRVKRASWGGHFVLVREPERVIRDVTEDHPLHGLVNAVHHLPHMIMVDTLTGQAWPDVQNYADLNADDWHEVLT